MTILINFLFLAGVVLFLVKVRNRLRKQEQAAPAEPAPTPEDVQLLREIRDELKKQG